MRKLFVLVLVSLMLCAVGSSPNCTEAQTELTETAWENFSHNRLLTEAEIIFMADKFERRDHEGFPELSEDQIEQLKNAFIERGLLPEEEDEVTEPPLPNCGGYWNNYHYKTEEHIERVINSYSRLYYSWPNCIMDAPGNDCGSDKDFMLSFYFGWHNEGLDKLASMLRWDSYDPWVRYYMAVLHGSNFSGRLYQGNPNGGADNYNVYMCLPGRLRSGATSITMEKHAY